MSILIPLGLFLKVGGNNENMAKWIVSPDASSPLTVRTKLFVSAAAEIVGLILVSICAQLVCEPTSVTLVAPKIAPVASCKERVADPLNDEEVGKR